MMKQVLVILLFMLNLRAANTQMDRPIRFQHITSESGLSQGHILCMLQDREGYIWIGTYFGLNRFNGYSINFYTENSMNPQALINKVVYGLCEGNDGCLWVATVAGLDRFDKKTDTFEHIPSDTTRDKDGSPKGLGDRYIHVVKQDNAGNIWVGTNQAGINRIDVKTKKIRYFQKGFGTGDKLCSNTINDLCVDRKHRLWIATEGGGLSCMDLTTYSVKTYRKSGDKTKVISSNQITCLLEDRVGKIWFGNGDGILTSFDDQTNKFETHEFLPSDFKARKVRIQDIEQEVDGAILIATMGAGLVVYNEKTGRSFTNVHHLKDPGTIISNEVYSLLVDRTGTVFAGTYGMGISRYSPANRKFPVYFVPSTDIEGDKNSYTDCIEDSYGRLLFGTYNGFFVFDRKANTFKHYLPGNTYEDNKILTLARGPDGSIWLGSNHSLHRYDKDLHKIKSYVVLNDHVDHPIYSIYFDHLNNLWFGLFIAEGLFKVPESEWRNSSKNTLNYKLYRVNYNDSTTLSGDEIWCLKQDKKKNLWIADNQGISRYNYDKDNFTRIKLTNMPKTIEFDQNDNLWVTTRGDGVYFYNVTTKASKHFTTNQGLCQNFVFGALADSNNELWFNTENGLSRFNPKTEKFRNYDIFDGLPSNRFDDRSEKKLSTGELYFGTAQGFVIFNPNDIKDDTSKSTVVLTDFKISNVSAVSQSEMFDSPVLNAPVGNVSEIKLAPSQRDFSFEFVALNFAAPHKIKYSYKLDGFDNNWIKTNAQNRIARYTNLDGGTYTFMVKATNGDGIWNNTPLMIKVQVIPPFYKTIRFRLLVVVFLIFLVIFGFSYKIAREVKQRQKLTRLVAERTFEISEKNDLLEETAENLSETNTLLEERQQFIEEQKEEIAAHRDELAKINAQKDKLFSIIAHDLKNPFNVIMGYTELLLANNHSYDAEKRQKFLSLLQQSSHNAYLLLENLLQWSRAQNGTLAFDPAPIKIEKLVTYSINQIRDLAENKGISIVFEYDQREVSVMVDENMINTVLRNILTNAVKFSNKNGSIIIHTSESDGEHALISIRDTGIGMSKEILDNLFRLDKSVSTSGTAGEKGTGLGMVLCKDFIDTHKGKIYVESEPGKGTTFNFTVPLAN